MLQEVISEIFKILQNKTNQYTSPSHNLKRFFREHWQMSKMTSVRVFRKQRKKQIDAVLSL